MVKSKQKKCYNVEMKEIHYIKIRIKTKVKK